MDELLSQEPDVQVVTHHRCRRLFLDFPFALEVCFVVL